MSDLERWAAVDRYIVDRLVSSDGVLEEALTANAAAGLPAHDVAPNQGKLLHLLAKLRGARSILELGTLGGYSTIWLARTLPKGGRLITLESEHRYAEVARANIGRAELGDVVELRVGRALDALFRLFDEGTGPFDLVSIDADKRTNPEYLGAVLKLSRPGTLIVADNVVRDGAVADGDEADPTVDGIRRFYELVAADPRLSATVVQTVGVKGWDGFALVLVG